MRVNSNLYLYLWDDSTQNNCNSVLITGKVPILIDPGHFHLIQELFGRIREDGFDPDRIEVIIGTHGHPDHFEGVRAFKKGTVKVGLSKPEAEYIAQMQASQPGQQGRASVADWLDFYLTEGDLVVGKHEFQVILTPGHTPGGLAIYWPQYKVLISGDIVFLQSVGRHDFPGGDVKQLQDSVDRLSKLPVELLIPGHGSAIPGQQRVQANFDLVRRMYFRR